MKNIIWYFLIVILIFTNCNNEQRVESESQFQYYDSSMEETIFFLDTLDIETDSSSEYLESLIKSTEHSNKKVTEIKTMKKENSYLKKELIQTKEELKQVKKSLDSTIQENETKKKKSFLKTVIDNIKREKDSVK